MTAGSPTLNQIYAINRSLQLPSQPPEETLYNQALGQIATTVPLILPEVENDIGDPILPPDNSSVHRVLIIHYSRLLGRSNPHIARYDDDLPLNKPYFYVVTIKPNVDGIWTNVGRTIFLHRSRPIVTLDYIGTSSPPKQVTSSPNPSNDFVYLRPADIGPPPPQND
jgi:hypothetical protein